MSGGWNVLGDEMSEDGMSEDEMSEDRMSEDEMSAHPSYNQKILNETIFRKPNYGLLK